TLDALRIARSIKHLNIMLEQPCPTLKECLQIREACALPMKLDESVYDVHSILNAYQSGCMDAAALKLSKMGGLSNTRKIRDLCLSLGTQMCIEDTWGSNIATAAALHLAASTPQKGLLNTCDLSGYVSPIIDSNAPKRKNGRIQPPENPGLGISPDLDILGTEKIIID
ncbi:MAG: enolase C-terminal domain-like protein, partial [Pseudomonadota bacterium]